MASFDDSLPMILNRTLDSVMPSFRELFARYDLTEQQWRVMRVLWSSKKITSNKLSERTLLPAPSLVGIVDRLEKKGLVTRIRSVEDRRIVHVIATAKGRALEREVTRQAAEIDARLRSCVDRKDWDAMRETLERIATRFSETEVESAAGGH